MDTFATVSYKALGVFQVSVTSSAATIAALVATAVPASASMVMIQPRGGDVRLTDDGQTPTVGAAGLGLDVKDGFVLVYNGSIPAIRLIAAVTTNCTLAFYG